MPGSFDKALRRAAPAQISKLSQMGFPPEYARNLDGIQADRLLASATKAEGRNFFSLGWRPPLKSPRAASRGGFVAPAQGQTLKVGSHKNNH